VKTLGLLRHAKSDWDDMSLRDYDRGLNDRGKRGAAIMGGHIRAHGVAWDLLLASPAERVRRTIDATRLKIPTMTQNGQVFRLRGHGMPAVSKPDDRGDLYVTVEAELPKQLTPEQREIFEALKKLDAGSAS